jgi:hypothetical protein
MTVQSLAAIARQVIAIAAVVMGALTSALSGIHLPPAISTALVVAGAVILAIEHYVGDPSTGTPAATLPAPAPLPVPTPAPAPQATPV